MNETGEEIFHRFNEISVEYKHVYLCGDFNANDFDEDKRKKIELLGDYFHLLNDHCPTYIAGNFNPSQLDLFFTKSEHEIKCFGHFPATGISNHSAIYIIANSFTTKKEIETYTFRNYSLINEDSVRNFVETTDMGLFTNITNVDDAIDKLYEILNSFLKK